MRRQPTQHRVPWQQVEDVGAVHQAGNEQRRYACPSLVPAISIRATAIRAAIGWTVVIRGPLIQGALTRDPMIHGPIIQQARLTLGPDHRGVLQRSPVGVAAVGSDAADQVGVLAQRLLDHRAGEGLSGVVGVDRVPQHFGDGGRCCGERRARVRRGGIRARRRGARDGRSQHRERQVQQQRAWPPTAQRGWRVRPRVHARLGRAAAHLAMMAWATVGRAVGGRATARRGALRPALRQPRRPTAPGLPASSLAPPGRRRSRPVRSATA